MPYVTSVQRIGREEGEATLLRRLLVYRFGTLPETVEARLAQASTGLLEILAERVLDAPSLAAVFDGAPLSREKDHDPENP